jgi:hypothetical protein
LDIPSAANVRITARAVHVVNCMEKSPANTIAGRA